MLCSVMSALGGVGHHCTTVEEIIAAVSACLHLTDRPALINISIDPFAQRKPQQFDWLTRSEAKL